MSYGKERPATARLAPMEWLLQVRDRAQGTPSLMTPHCLSTSTGPVGLSAIDLEVGANKKTRKNKLRTIQLVQIIELLVAGQGLDVLHLLVN
jgi:hypothetical protein